MIPDFFSMIPDSKFEIPYKDYVSIKTILS